MSRKTKGSKRRNKAKQKVAQLHERMTNQRKDMLHKLSTKLIRENDIICMEDLAVRKWTCPDCSPTHDRDINAAKNILTGGLRMLA
ncbi:MAG: transposase [Butyricicoccus pullicaecorum]|nr:transposase [Butyricicoccus pullicaecorum]